MFLSANNYFWRVVRKDDLIVKSSRWRDLGRPEARLIGVQYMGHQRRRGLLGRAEDTRERVDVRGNGSAVSGRRSPAVASRSTRSAGHRPGTAGRRRDPAPLRAWDEGADDVLRDGPRSAGVRRRGVPSHARGDERPRGLADAREPVGADGDAVIARHIAVATTIIVLLLALAGEGMAGSPSLVCSLPQGSEKLPASARRGFIDHLLQYPNVRLATPAERRRARGILEQLEASAAREGWRSTAAAERAGFDTRTLRGSPATHPSTTSTRSAIRSRGAARSSTSRGRRR